MKSSPPCSEVDKAKRILTALKEAAPAQGKGAASLDGRLIDAASEKVAKQHRQNGRSDRCQNK
ncbi:MAG: hypothetical protein P0107_04525 [Nitrosomonas sp.]|nr:hypothetical protein [Nitrosomonas sp.]